MKSVAIFWVTILLLIAFIIGYILGHRPATVQWHWDSYTFDTLKVPAGSCVAMKHAAPAGYEVSKCESSSKRR